MKILLIIMCLLIHNVSYGQKGKKIGNIDICKSINEEYDKFENVKSFITYSSSDQISFYKVIRGSNAPKYFINLETYTSATKENAKGGYLILSNGDRISRPDAEVNIKTVNDRYKFSVTFKLNLDEVELLTQHYITDFKVYYNAVEVSKVAQNRYQRLINCLVEKK